MRTTYPDNTRHKQRPGPDAQRAEPRARDAANERPTHRRAADTTGRRQRDTAPVTAAAPYSPRNALIAGISRTAWTRPAR